MEYNNLLELIKTVSDSNISNFKYEEGNMKILMSSGDIVMSDDEIKSGQTAVKMQIPVEAMADALTENEPAKQKSVENLKVVKSPLVGTFYTAPSEAGEPFVNVGDSVKKGQTVGIVEAMKLMNDIESDFDGIVTEVYVNNGESVEYGQPLFAIA